MSSKIFNSIIIFGFLLMPQLSFSQQNQKIYLVGSASLDCALYDGASLGLGAHLKLLKPFRKNNNAIVAGFDVDILSYPESYSEGEIDFSFILASIGYRKRIKSFYIEPQLGGGLYNELGYYAPCIFIGLEPGIQKERFSYSFNYRFISADGIVYGEHLHSFAIKVGYRISRNKKH